MIKFFRRIRQKLLSENKFSKYLLYAIGEIILVVIGILIALQINAWNGEKKDRIRERSFLNSIHREFVANQIQFDTVAYYHKRGQKSTEKLVSMFPIDIKKTNLDTVAKYLYEIIPSHTYNPTQGTIESIVYTSSFNVIQNQELRDILVAWNGILLDFQEDEISSKNVINEKLDPLLAKHLDFDFDLNDPRNNLEVLESLEFEFFVKLRLSTLNDIFYRDFGRLEAAQTKIIELTAQKNSLDD